METGLEFACEAAKRGFIKFRPTNLDTSTTSLYHEFLQFPLGAGPVDNALIDGVGCDESVHNDGPGLAEAVASILSLEIALRILLIDTDNSMTTTLIRRSEHCEYEPNLSRR